MGSVDAGASRGIVIDDVSVQQVWERLTADPRAAMVDVRTRAEWAYVGVPDLSAIGKKLLLLEWQSFPDASVDPHFAERMSALLVDCKVDVDDEVFFICRSGGRSKSAARVMTAAGFKRCRNVADGFEGPLDPDRHRGRLGGWKSAGLPWAQS